MAKDLREARTLESLNGSYAKIATLSTGELILSLGKRIHGGSGFGNDGGFNMFNSNSNNSLSSFGGSSFNNTSSSIMFSSTPGLNSYGLPNSSLPDYSSSSLSSLNTPSSTNTSTGIVDNLFNAGVNGGVQGFKMGLFYCSPSIFEPIDFVSCTVKFAISTSSKAILSKAVDMMGEEVWRGLVNKFEEGRITEPELNKQIEY